MKKKRLIFFRFKGYTLSKIHGFSHNPNTFDPSYSWIWILKNQHFWWQNDTFWRLLSFNDFQKNFIFGPNFHQFLTQNYEFQNFFHDFLSSRFFLFLNFRWKRFQFFLGFLQHSKIGFGWWFWSFETKFGQKVLFFSENFVIFFIIGK